MCAKFETIPLSPLNTEKTLAVLWDNIINTKSFVVKGKTMGTNGILVVDFRPATGNIAMKLGSTTIYTTPGSGGTPLYRLYLANRNSAASQYMITYDDVGTDTVANTFTIDTTVDQALSVLSSFLMVRLVIP